MSNQNIKYFSTGEFAKLCKVNKQTLIYYDQIGLLSPIMKDARGYRSYSIAQYDFFGVIELLKEMGMSLKEIQKYMENKSPENFLQLMTLQKEIVQEKLRALEIIEKIIDVKIESTKEAIQLDFNAITIEHLPPQNFYLSKNIENTTEEQFVEAISDFIADLNRSKLDTGHPIGAIIKRKEIISGNTDNYSYLYIKQPVPQKGHELFTTIGGKHLIAYHIGDAPSIKKTYEKILVYLNEHNYEIAQYAYEEYVYDAVIHNSEQEYVTKIVIEISTK